MRRLAEIDPEEVAQNNCEQSGEAERTFASRVLRVITGVTLGVAWVYVSRRHSLSMNPMLIPRLAIGYVLSVAAHEAGHASAAVLQRFRISAFAVWPLHFYRGPSKWHVGWAKRGVPQGFVGITPRNVDRLRLRQFMVVAAGPLVSIAIAAGCWMALNAVDAPKWAADQLLIVALWSAVMAAGGLLPFRRGPAVSDGERVRVLIRNGPEWKRASAQLAIAAAAMKGTRPREWREDLVETAMGPEDGSSDARVGRALRYNWLLDSGQIDEAEDQLVSLLLEPCTDEVLREWMLQGAWFAAIFRKDAITARKWFEAGRGSAAPAGCNLLMAETALAFVEERRTDLKRLVPQTIECCVRNMDTGTAEAVRDVLATVVGYCAP